MRQGDSFTIIEPDDDGVQHVVRVELYRSTQDNEVVSYSTFTRCGDYISVSYGVLLMKRDKPPRYGLVTCLGCLAA